MPAYPALQPMHRFPVLGQLVVTPPALDKLPPRVSQLITGFALAVVPQLSHLRFESFEAFWCYSDLQFAVHSKAQELSLPPPSCSAFGFVHLQPQMLLDPVPDRSQRPFRRRMTAYVNITVIRIAAV